MGVKKRSDRLDWEDVRFLLELARQGSLSATARALGVTHATVKRRISNIERDLCQPLFVRENGRYVLTDGGKRILAIALPMADSAQAILRAANGLEERLTGPVRITCTETVGSFIVLPALNGFCAAYPDIGITLNISQLNVSLARSDADIAVRLVKPDPARNLSFSKVAVLDYHFYAAHWYVDATPTDHLAFLGYPEELGNWPEVETIARLAHGRRIALRTNSLGNRIEAARRGMGVALLPSIMAVPWPELVQVSQGRPAMQREIYIVVHRDLKDVPRIKACFAALAEAIRVRLGPS